MCLRSKNNLYERIYEKAYEMKEKADIPSEIHTLLHGIIDEMAFHHKELTSQSQDIPEFDLKLFQEKVNNLV